MRWGSLRRVGNFEGQQAAVGRFGFINCGEEAPLIVGCITVDPDLLASLRRSFCRLKFVGFIDILSRIVTVEMFYSFINE